MTARVGLIIPSSNRMVEQEMARFFPPGVALHVARLRMTGPHHVPLAQLLPRVEEATRTLVDAACDVVAFHCTATSMEEGMDGEERVLAAVTRAGAPRATTTATAIRRAFAALGARRIVLVTPYSARTTTRKPSSCAPPACEVLPRGRPCARRHDTPIARPAGFLARARHRGRAPRGRRLSVELRQHRGARDHRRARAPARTVRSFTAIRRCCGTRSRGSATATWAAVRGACLSHP